MNKPTDAQLTAEIKENAARIASNPEHPIMKMEQVHKEAARHD